MDSSQTGTSDGEADAADTGVARRPAAAGLVPDVRPVGDDAEMIDPDGGADQFVRHTHEGVDYLALLSGVHRVMRPESYLEIGTDKGDSLRLARCASIAVDPSFKITSGVIGEKPMMLAFQMTSDAFFARNLVGSLLPRGFDLAFLDGMHLFEFLLRDFIYVEECCHWRSVVMVHDCLPPNIEITEREYRPHLRKDELWRIYWTGDVWKLVPILQQYRPDLHMTLFDTPPSGLVMIKGLDPKNKVLRDNYAKILDEFRNTEFDEQSFREFYSGLRITSSRSLLDGMALSAFF